MYGPSHTYVLAIRSLAQLAILLALHAPCSMLHRNHVSCPIPCSLRSTPNLQRAAEPFFTSSSLFPLSLLLLTPPEEVIDVPRLA